MTSRPVEFVLIVNPHSGGGKAARVDLVAQCRTRGIDPIVFEPGDDLTALATAAVGGGAKALSMAGGDGVTRLRLLRSRPSIVSVRVRSRRHPEPLSLDLGIDPHDDVGALDASSNGHERPIDLGRVMAAPS